VVLGAGLRRTGDQQSTGLARKPRHRGAELISLSFAGESKQQLSVPAGIYLCRSSPAVVAGSADDDVGVAVSIDITRAGDMTPKIVGRVFCGHRDQEALILPEKMYALPAPGALATTSGMPSRLTSPAASIPIPSWSPGFPSTLQISLPVLVEIHVDPARVLAAKILGRSGSHKIRRTVAINVTNATSDPTELVVAPPANPFADDLHRFHKRICEVRCFGQDRSGTAPAPESPPLASCRFSA
jgi:hypothetical protein